MPYLPTNMKFKFIYHILAYICIYTYLPMYYTIKTDKMFIKMKKSKIKDHDNLINNLMKKKIETNEYAIYKNINIYK